MTPWTRYRRWKLLTGPLLFLPALVLMKTGAEFSLAWYAGLGIALALAVAYLGEEIFWIRRRQGRPCGRCGEKIRMKAFRLSFHCPHCGLPLE